MIVALMQPYFFPYLGYFQLMQQVDRFVFYDDAQFMKGGWVNRNRILRDGAPAWWTFPVVRDDFRLPIRARRYARDGEAVATLARKLAHAYRDAPHRDAVLPWLQDTLEACDDGVADVNIHHLGAIARRLGIECELLRASALPGTGETGVARVLEVCRTLGARAYLNSSGGRALYDAGDFGRHGLRLEFLESLPTDYPQLGAPHVPYLSIVDVLMFTGWDGARALLGHCRREVAH